MFDCLCQFSMPRYSYRVLASDIKPLWLYRNETSGNAVQFAVNNLARFEAKKPPPGDPIRRVRPVAGYCRQGSRSARAVASALA